MMRRFTEWRMWRLAGARMRRLTGAPIWRRVAHGRVAVGIALFALLATGALASTGFIVRAFIPPSTHSRAVQAKRPNPKDEGKWFQLSHFGKSHPAPDARAKAYQQAAKLPRSALGTSIRKNGSSTGQSLSATLGSWLPLGPQPIDSTTCGPNCYGPYGNMSGRVTAVAVDPTNANDIWAGAADGGVWHSTDGGATWTPITDTQSTLSIGSIAIDAHTTPHTIYVGTGEGNFSGDAYWGVGVLKITLNNGAPTITRLGTSYFGGLSIGKLAVLDPDPNNNNNATLLAAVNWDGNTAPAGSGANTLNVGIWRSTDGGATWTQVVADSQTVNGFYPDFGTDVLFDPAHPGVAYAGLADVFGIGGFPTIAGIYISTDSGAKWTHSMTGAMLGIDSVKIGRVTLGLSANGKQIYAVLADSGGDQSGNFGGLIQYFGVSSIFGGPVSINASPPYNPVVTWGDTHVANVPGMASDDNEYQWWYDDVAGVDPSDATGKILYVGGVDIWKTTDGGSTWTNVTDVYGANPVHVHPDEHAIAFLPGSSSFYIGNDGGVWSGTNTGTFTNLNAGLNTAQFYAGSIGEVGADPHLYGGAQDNGTVQYPNANVSGVAKWNQVLDGDGGYTAVDYTNNAVIYAEFQYGILQKSTDAGAHWAYADYNHDGKGFPGSVNFVMPVIESPNNHDELLVGTDRVYQTINGTSSWAAISPVFDTYSCSLGTCTAPISALAIAPGNDGTIYAGDFLGDVFASTDGGAHWQTNRNFFCLYSMVTGLAVDPNDPNVAYATCAGFTGGAQHVYKTTDAALHWTDVSASLPDIPFEGVLVDPNNSNIVIAGTDVGVFVSQNAGGSWAQLGTGLPNVAIDQIFANHTGTELFVASHGRGMWELTLSIFRVDKSAIALTTVPGSSPVPLELTISNPGIAPMAWSQTATLPSWLNLSASSGTVPAGGSQQITLTFTTPSTTPQTYTTNLVFSSPGSVNSPATVPVTVVSVNVSKQWYFAEGFTGGSFTTYLTLENPNSVQANVQVQYLLQGGSPVTKTYTVNPAARSTINVNKVIGAGYSVSMVVTSDQPIVAERPMYFTYNGSGVSGPVPGGSDVLGATSLGTAFDFAYVDTSANHDTYFTILNNNATDMTATITYYPAAGGSGIAKVHTIPANARGTIHVNTSEGLTPGSYSALVALSEPGLVERPMYLIDSVTGQTGSADVVGVGQPAPTWAFAEGFTGSSTSPFSERYILANPGSSALTGTVTFYKPGGGYTQVNVSIPAGGQTVVDADSVLGTGVSNSAVVAMGGNVLAERFMSFLYNGPVGTQSSSNIPGATDVLGDSSEGNLYYFAEGYTGGQFAEYLTILNNDIATNKTATVTVTFLPANGAAPTVQTYTVVAGSPFTLNTANVMGHQSFSMIVESNAPIVAERTMYFSYPGPNSSGQTGGTDVIGYQGG